MTKTHTQKRTSLRPLAAADLASVTGGFVIYGSTSLSTVESTSGSSGSVGGGLSERTIMFWSGN